MKLRANVFEVKENLFHWGFWYCVWFHGIENLWTIWCAYQMQKHEDKMAKLAWLEGRS